MAPRQQDDYMNIDSDSDASMLDEPRRKGKGKGKAADKRTRGKGKAKVNEVRFPFSTVYCVVQLIFTTLIATICLGG